MQYAKRCSLAILKSVLVIAMTSTFFYACLDWFEVSYKASSQDASPQAFYQENSAVRLIDSHLKSWNENSPATLIPDDNKIYLPRINLTHSFYTTGKKDFRTNLLCKLKVNNRCFMSYPSEVVERFWIISPIYSAYQTKTTVRYVLHNNFQNYVGSIGMSPCTLEAIRVDRDQDYLITSPGKEPYEIQSTFYDDIYIRENLLNVAAKKIGDWEYIAWIDAHHLFDNVYWWEDAIIDMEKYGSVQLFRMLNWESSENYTYFRRAGAIYASTTKRKVSQDYDPYFGNAYSVRREIYDQMEYIFDRGVGGCCDCAYVKASLDNYTEMDYMNHWPNYTAQFKPWIEKAQKAIQGKRQSIRGDVYHLSHEFNMPYLNLMEYFDVNGFDIYKDMTVDVNGTFKLTNVKFKQIIEEYSYAANHQLEKILMWVAIGIVIGGGCLCWLYKRHVSQKKMDLYQGSHAQ